MTTKGIKTKGDRRLDVINSQMDDIYDSVDELSEALVDKEIEDAINAIEKIRTFLNITKDSITNGDFV